MTTRDKAIKKAFAYAYSQGIEWNNYPVTQAWVKGNDFHAIHVNEYGGEYSVLHLYGCANVFLSYREIKSLS